MNRSLRLALILLCLTNVSTVVGATETDEVQAIVRGADESDVILEATVTSICMRPPDRVARVVFQTINVIHGELEEGVPEVFMWHGARVPARVDEVYGRNLLLLLRREPGLSAYDNRVVSDVTVWRLRDHLIAALRDDTLSEGAASLAKHLESSFRPPDSAPLPGPTRINIVSIDPPAGVILEPDDRLRVELEYQIPEGATPSNYQILAVFQTRDASRSMTLPSAPDPQPLEKPKGTVVIEFPLAELFTDRRFARPTRLVFLLNEGTGGRSSRSVAATTPVEYDLR